MKELNDTEFNEELNDWISSIDDLIRIHGIDYASNIIGLIGVKIKGLKLILLAQTVNAIKKDDQIPSPGTTRLNILSGLMSGGTLLLWF